jgi:hypothetical protein
MPRFVVTWCGGGTLSGWQILAWMAVAAATLLRVALVVAVIAVIVAIVRGVRAMKPVARVD